MKVLIIISSPMLGGVELRCIESVMDQDAEGHLIDFHIATSPAYEPPSIWKEPLALNRVVVPLLDAYDYFFVMQSDILLPQNALATLLSNVPAPVILALVPYRKMSIAPEEDWEKMIGHCNVSFLNERPLLDNIEKIKAGKPFLLTSFAYFGWNCILIHNNILRLSPFPFTVGRSYDISFSEDLMKITTVLVDPRVKVGHIDRDGTIYYYDR